MEAALAAGSGARLRVGPRLVCPGFDTGYPTLDALLQGGFPVAGTTELVGGRSSGRATIAAAYLARRTREGHVCAWVDVAGEMDPQGALANGMDAARVLWVRCTGGEQEVRDEAVYLPAAEVVPRMPVRDKTIGTPGVRNRPLKETPRVEQVNSDRQPARRGERVVQAAAERMLESRPGPAAGKAGGQAPFARAKKPWTRMEQAIRAVDLLVQGGGFGGWWCWILAGSSRSMRGGFRWRRGFAGGRRSSGRGRACWCCRRWRLRVRARSLRCGWRRRCRPKGRC